MNSYIDVFEVPMHFCGSTGKPLGKCIGSYMNVGDVKSQGVCEGICMEVCRSRGTLGSSYMATSGYLLISTFPSPLMRIIGRYQVKNKTSVPLFTGIYLHLPPPQSLAILHQ